MAKLDLSVIVKTVGAQNLRRLNGDLSTVGTTATKTQSKLGSLTSGLTGLITPQTALIAGGVALAGAFSGAAKAAIEEQKGVALLTQAIKANDPEAQGNIANIEATIKERQKLAFADDLQRESLGSLISVTKDSNKALELQRVAMDLARLKGIDLATASTLIGKVYAGNLGILSRYGIQLEKGATATEAIAEIQRRAAGQAEAYAETTAGAFESAQLAMDDVVEDIGAELLPALTEIAVVTRDNIIPAFRTMGEALEVVGGAGEVVEGLINAFNPAAGIAEAFGEEVDKATEKIENLEQAGRQTALAMPRNIQAMVDAMQKGGPVIAAEAGKIAGMLPAEIQAKVDTIRQAGADTVVAFAAGILEKQQDPGLAWEAAQSVFETALTRTEEIAQIHGRLSSGEFTAGINDGRPAVSAAFRAYAVEAQHRLAFLGADAFTWGSGIGYSMANGIYTVVPVVRNAAGELANAVRGQIGIRSEPDDPSSPLRGITEWGGNIAKELAHGIESNLSLGTAAGAALASTLVPSVAGTETVGSGSRAGATEIHYHTHLTVQGDLTARNTTEAEDALLRVSRFSAV